VQRIGGGECKLNVPESSNPQPPCFALFLLAGGRPRRFTCVIHAGGLPRLRPCPAAIRSNTKMAWSMPSRSARSSAIIFDRFIQTSVACGWRWNQNEGVKKFGRPILKFSPVTDCPLHHASSGLGLPALCDVIAFRYRGRKFGRSDLALFGHVFHIRAGTCQARSKCSFFAPQIRFDYATFR